MGEHPTAMKYRHYAYIGVSSIKQGEKGPSSKAQRSAIEAYARTHDLDIVEWFEDRKRSSKEAHPHLAQMGIELAHWHAHGAILFKIDRGAQNRRYRREIDELIDKGFDVHFA